MRGGRILWGQIAVVFTIVVVTTWTATQWTAWRLGFQAQLGNPWFELAGWPIYYPPALIWWWYAFDAYAPTVFVEGDIIRNMHKALKADGMERDPMTFQPHDAAPEAPIVGRVVDKYLTDEMGENLTMVVDGIDGRTHHVPGIDPARVEDMPNARLEIVADAGHFLPEDAPEFLAELIVKFTTPSQGA